MIGDVLKRMRIIYGYKAKDLSSELGVSASYLSEIENNKKQPSLELLQKYADIFGIAFGKYGESRTTRKRNSFCKKNDGAVDSEYVKNGK